MCRLEDWNFVDISELWRQRMNRALAGNTVISLAIS